jgi:hypothetical protein
MIVYCSSFYKLFCAIRCSKTSVKHRKVTFRGTLEDWSNEEKQSPQDVLWCSEDNHRELQFKLFYSKTTQRAEVLKVNALL